MAPGSVPGPDSPYASAVFEPDGGGELRVDPLGLQPLYWTRLADGTILASSWLAQLVDQPGVDRTYDVEVVLLEALRLPPVDEFAVRTRFAAIHRVPGGHLLRIRPDGSTRLERYWSTDELPEPDGRLSLHDAADLLRARVDEAVRRLLPDSGGVGGHVSGGLDCTSVTCRAQQILAEDGRSLAGAYSWSPDETVVERRDSDERVLLDAVSDRLGMPVRRVSPSPDGSWFDELTADRYPQTTHAFERFVLPLARADGVTTMLSGWGGDELSSFNGRAVLRSLVRRGRWLSAWEQTDRRRAVLGGADPGPLRRVRSFMGVLLANAPGDIDRLRRPGEHRQQRELEAETDAMITQASPVVAELARRCAGRFTGARNHHEYQRALLENGHLQRRVDGWYQTGRLFDVDYRYPLLDLGVVSSALSLPWTAYASQGWTRIAFRLAVEPWVPASVAWNVTKEEPALFSGWLSAGAGVSGGERLPDDAAYRDMVLAAERIHGLRPRRPITPSGVRSRPELAPRSS